MVTWAQRPNLVFLTICLEDCDKPEIKVEADQLHFKGVGGPDKKPHEVTIKFFKEIDTEVRFLTSWCNLLPSDGDSINIHVSSVILCDYLRDIVCSN